MKLTDWITLLSTFVTLVGMIVTIVMANSARKSKDAAKTALTVVQLSAVAERLKSAQEHIRDVAPDKVVQRGFKIGSRVDLIRREFDGALSALPKAGKGSGARDSLARAQSELNKYQLSISSGGDQSSWQDLQKLVQDTISELVSVETILGA